ncbi:MAG: DUF4339 domain-containing protein [Calditrichaeota bacterium]|nr:MAG: DUF4339 domain-containing protein [Calditrichota bacterium]
MHAMDGLFLKVNETEFGPVTPEEIKDLVKEGSFSPDDLVWSEELDDWVAAGELEKLRPLFESGNGKHNRPPGKVIAIASGKGGVGKTVLTTSIGVGLASMGHEVVMVDADLGGPDLHTCMGMLEPELTFFDFYSLQKDSLNEIVLDTPVENLRLISGACGTLGLANLKYFQKRRLIRELKKVHADAILLDLGAGSAFDVIDFFMLADEKLLVMTPEPTSIYEAFGFIKICLMRELNRALKAYPEALEILAREEVNRPGKARTAIRDILRQIEDLNQEAAASFRDVLDSFSPRLVLNMVKQPEEVKEGQALQAAAMELLSVYVQYLGYISYDPNVTEAIKSLKPFLLHAPKSRAAQDLAALIRVNLLGKKGVREILERRRWRKQMENTSRDYPEHDGLDEAPICSINCFYWDDCEYQDGGKPCRVRHLEPVLRE